MRRGRYTSTGIEVLKLRLSGFNKGSQILVLASSVVLTTTCHVHPNLTLHQNPQDPSWSTFTPILHVSPRICSPTSSQPRRMSRIARNLARRHRRFRLLLTVSRKLPSENPVRENARISPQTAKGFEESVLHPQEVSNVRFSWKPLVRC